MSTPAGPPIKRKHPAKFSAPIITKVSHLLLDMHFEGVILDPFAGVGGVHTLADKHPSWTTWGIELEPEWAFEHPATMVGDATHLPAEWTGLVDAVVTSPPYGNRMADKDMRPTVAATYMKQLGRESSPGSMNHQQWGEDYRMTALLAMAEMDRVLKPDGLILLNVSNHVRGGEVIDVVDWYRRACQAIPWHVEKIICIPTQRMRRGANHAARVEAEALIVARKP